MELILTVLTYLALDAYPFLDPMSTSSPIDIHSAC